MADMLTPEDFGISRLRRYSDEAKFRPPTYEEVEAANAVSEFFYTYLTTQQRAFVQRFLTNGFDGPEAAVDAGFAHPGRTAENVKIAKRLLKKEYIAKAVDLGRNYRALRNGLTMDQLIDEHKKIAFANPQDYYDEDGNIDIPFHDRDAMRAVAEIYSDKHNKVRLKLYDPRPSIDFLAKYTAQKTGQPDPTTAPQIGGTTNITNNFAVQTINILPVATGEFVPAPQNPYKTIEHSPMLDDEPNQLVTTPDP